MCYTCLKPKKVCKSRKCDNIASVPEVLKCAICATWAESKGLAPFSIFFCKNIDRTELESCLLSCSTLSSMISLLPISEYELWVREMTMSGLDFKNPVGKEIFNCFKRICVIERNMCESSRTDSAPVDSLSTGTKKTTKSSHKVQI